MYSIPKWPWSGAIRNREMLREMKTYFFDEVDGLFPELHSLSQKGDFAEIGRRVHRMKGTIVCLGAEPASEAASRVERLVRHACEQARS